MAVGIRPNTALAQAAGLHCDRGIVVNDTMQTFDPRIYAVGECVAHRGIAYGLVAPLFEMAKVCANHLAHIRHRPLRRLADLDQAQGHRHRPVLRRRFHRRRRHRGDRAVGPGRRRLQEARAQGRQAGRRRASTATPWTARGTSSCCAKAATSPTIRDRLMFGESNLGDTGHLGQNQRRGDGRRGRGLRLQRRVQRARSSRRSRTRACSRSTRCASTPRRRRRAARAPGLVEQILMATAGGDYSAAPKKKAMCGCTDRTHQEVRDAIREHHLLTIPEAMSFPRMAHAQRLRQLPARRSTTTCSRPGRTRRRTIRSRASSTSARTPTSRRTAPSR